MESVEVVIAGYQKKNRILSTKEKLIVSYHEVGHALVAALQTNSAPVQKITIIPRTSGALGFTMQVDEGEKYLMTKEELENKIATFTGGRVAEELVFGDVTTGASNDIEQATKLARAIITRYGMSEFGMVAMESLNNVYLGGDTSMSCSQETAEEEAPARMTDAEQLDEKFRTSFAPDLSGAGTEKDIDPDAVPDAPKPEQKAEEKPQPPAEPEKPAEPVKEAEPVKDTEPEADEPEKEAGPAEEAGPAPAEPDSVPSRTPDSPPEQFFPGGNYISRCIKRIRNRNLHIRGSRLATSDRVSDRPPTVNPLRRRELHAEKPEASKIEDRDVKHMHRGTEIGANDLYETRG